MSYIPPPKALIAFSDAVIVKSKTLIQGSNQKCRRWQTLDHKFYEWDYQHGTVEKYDKNGRHLGEFDPVTGKQTKKADPNRKIEP
jgi:antitoxin component YwqK of YwqJK toxin-antitoxin module